MNCSRLIFLIGGTVSLLAGAAAAAPDAEALAHFEKRVRPLLVMRCQKCHGADKAENGLRLDSAAALAKGGDTGPALVAGRPDASLLIQAVRQTGDLKMPPDGKLSDQEVADLAAWVQAGAVWGDDSTALPTAAPSDTAPLAPNAPELAPVLEAWYKADALQLADNSTAPVWPDQGQHGRDLSATQGVRADGVGQPPRFVLQSAVNRRPALRFEPTSGLAASPGNPVAIRGDASLSIVLVMSLQVNDAQPPYDGVLGLGNPANPGGDPGRPLAALVQINRDEQSLRLAGGWNHDASLGPGSFQSLYGKPLILTIVKSPGPMKGTARFFINGRPSAEVFQRDVEGREMAPDIQHRSDIGLYMGRAVSWCGSFRGDVAEAIVYSAALDEQQRAALEAGLSEKYAIALASQFRGTRVAFSPEQRGHWAFQPVHDPGPPGLPAAGTESPIDRLVLAKLAEKNLPASPPADKRTLIRRATFDLTGLPPTPDEVQAFLKDESPQAFAVVVDRLLASPHFREQWARHWLDVVRYAETTANDANAVMRYAYRYRDYVVDAFNRDLPYDQFIVQQLAGDLLPPTIDPSEALRRVIATGYLMVGPKALAETDKEQSRLDIVDDQIDVTGRAFLGLTLACARCHDHKFDPIPAVDYYALAGIFRSTEPFADEARNSSMWWEFPILEVPGEKPLIVMAPKETAPRNLRVHLRGNRFTLGALAPRGFLQVLSPAVPAEAASAGNGAAVDPTGGQAMQPAAAGPPMLTGSGRLELARWIASKENPLTARVMANRIWQYVFGAGLVATSDNFGKRGEAPSHPELLDYLSARFVENGWSVKGLLRLLLLSRTYQQQSAAREAGQQLDPDNRLLWRMPRRRLEAEAIRDAMLAVSGRLDGSLGGDDSSQVLYKEAEVLDAKRGFAPNRLQSSHPFYTSSTRRTIYLPVVRNALPDVLALFDGADPNGVTARRNDTTVPSQALFALNNPFVREQAQGFAARLLGDEKLTDVERVTRAYELALARPPAADEVAEALEFLQQYMALPAAQARPEAERRQAAWQSYCQMLMCTNEFLYLD